MIRYWWFPDGKCFYANSGDSYSYEWLSANSQFSAELGDVYVPDTLLMLRNVPLLSSKDLTDD